MNGAEALVATLVKGGIEVCFANPGTSELHFVSALDSQPQLRPVLCLFEGVATGAADGYGRMKGKPAATLLHLGPGLANGLANLHNARRAAVPIVNIVGDHATYHAQYDAPLASDIKGFAAPVSGWLRSTASALTAAADGAAAIAAAQQPPGQIATLILPADSMWLKAGKPADPVPCARPQPPAANQVEAIAAALAGQKRSALLLRGQVLSEAGLIAAGRVAAKTGARLLCDTFPPRLRRGAGMVAVERLPYFAEQAVEFLASIDHLVLVGAKPPVSFFAYPDKPSWLASENCAFDVLAQPHEDGVLALTQLADALDAPSQPSLITPAALPEIEAGFNQYTIGAVLAHALPTEAIVIDEAATSGLGPFIQMAAALPHDYLALTGGAIGIGMPLAVGAALACPERKVFALCGDGSAAYTLQALWTQAREKLNIVNIIFSNRSYAILNIELQRVGANAGPKALSVLDIGNPDLNWVALAEGMGVAAVRVQSLEALQAELLNVANQTTPHLIEVVLVD